MDPVTQLILLLTSLILLQAIGEWLFTRTGIPDILWPVALGILLGPVCGWIDIEQIKPIVPYFGAFALVVILASGGFSLEIASISRTARPALILALVSFLCTVLIVAAYLKLASVFGWVRPADWMFYLMIGAIVGGSSSVVIIPTMQIGQVRQQVSDLLSLESSITDALCVVVVVLLLDLMISATFALETPFLLLGKAVGIGVLVGTVLGVLLVPLVYAMHGHNNAYPALLAGILMVYALTSLAGGNAALGILCAAIVIGNAKWLVERMPRLSRRFPFSRKLRIDFMSASFHGQVIFLVKAFFFFMIGLLFPTSPRLILLGLGCAVLLWLARYPATWLATRGQGLSRRDFHLIAIAMPRGLAAGVMSSLPMMKGIPNTENLSAGVFAAIVSSIVLFSVGFSLLNQPAAAAGTDAPTGEGQESEKGGPA